ncbi:hypothetical protein V8E53_011140 [Lactarius tabidus]
MNGTQALLIDGYISQSFQSRAAEQYFLNLLKSSSIPPHTTTSYDWRGGYFFFVHNVPSHILAQFPNPQGRWLLDRGIMDGGTVVPQTMWSPHSVSDRRQHVEMGKLQMPVFFEHKDRALGFSLEASVDGQCHVLQHANVHAPLGHKSTTQIRIIWPGYKTFKRQIPIRDQSSKRNPITRAKFLGQVGRTVDAFLRARELDSGCVDDRSKLWQIGPGGIHRGDIVIIGAVHVSAGSWMPILQLNRYIV